MTHLALKDDLLDAQTLRTVSAGLFGGADVGECIATARRVRHGSLDSWHDEWRRTADAASALADAAEGAGEAETARLAHLRACSYFRTAGVMLMGIPLDPRLVETYALQTVAFRRAAALFPHPPEIIEIPFEGGALPGYFFRVDGDPRPRATVVAINGYDGTAEELYFWNVAAASARGYNVLAFDGPGQGATLLERGIPMRPDWENVIGPVVDHLLTRPDVDPARIALVGLSLGAHLGPRAASGEHRLAACVADCGAYDLYAAALARLPGPVRGPFDGGDRTVVVAVRALLHELMKQPTGGWALRRGLLVHGVEDPVDLIETYREYSLAGRAEHIRCPTWVCNAEGDDISASAPELVDALGCEKELVTFTAAEGGDDHCEVGARQLYHARAFGWLDARLRPREVGAAAASST